MGIRGRGLTPSEALAEQNPIEKIAAIPFVYPAASERPWINVVLADESSNERSVNFTWYGYEQYGLNYQQQVITIEPILSIGNGRMLKITPVDVSISKYEN